MPDEGHLRQALDGAERLDVLLHLVGEALAHFEDIPLREVLIRLAGEEDGLWVGEAEVVLQESHVP